MEELLGAVRPTLLDSQDTPQTLPARQSNLGRDASARLNGWNNRNIYILLKIKHGCCCDGHIAPLHPQGADKSPGHHIFNFSQVEVANIVTDVVLTKTQARNNYLLALWMHF